MHLAKAALAKWIKNFFRSDLVLLCLTAALFFAFHVATNGKYGFHRDELQTLDDARHLDWGFVAYPPLTPLIGRAELILFGTSLVGFRFFSALAVSLVMILTGLTVEELGGSRGVQILAAIAVAVSPLSLTQGAVFQYVAFDYLWGVMVTYFLVRLLKSEDPRWWLAIGITIGLGMETRYTMGVLALGLVGGVLLTPARRFLRSGWLWAGVAASLLVFLPNMVWQVRHHFISLQFLHYLHLRDRGQGRYRGFYREQLYTCVNLAAASLALLGLWLYLVHNQGQRFRLLGWTVVVSFALFAIYGSRAYYTAPLYPVLVAGGSVLLGHLLSPLRTPWMRFIYGLQWAAIAAGAVILAALVTPVAPIGSRIWTVTSGMHDQFREMIGWPDLAHAVAGVYYALPPSQRARTGILTGNYGEAGALNLYGPELGLPFAMGLTNSFWYRGYDPRLPDLVIVTGFDLAEGRKLFESCRVAAKNRNSFGVINEESRDHPDILLCRKLRMTWTEYWAGARRFG